MGFLSTLSDLAKKFTSGQANEQHFDQVAQNVPQESLANGISALLGSGGSANFGQMASQLFNGGNATQKSGMINTLLAGAGPGVLASFLGGGGAGSALSNLLKGGQSTVTPEQAAQVPADEVQQLAQHVHSQNGGIVDQMGSFYSQHPMLVKTLGAAALGLVVNHIADAHRNAAGA